MLCSFVEYVGMSNEEEFFNFFDFYSNRPICLTNFSSELERHN